LEESGRMVFEEALAVADGKRTSSEALHQNTYNGICVTGG
jgi:hypothetical protein